MILVPLLLTILFLPATLFATEFTDSVVSVLDGDTLDVLHNGQAERIRLSGIDCPEKGQAFGKNASSSRLRSSVARKS